MPLPTGGSIPLAPGQPSHPAYLIRFPEDAWEKILQSSRDGSLLSVSLDHGMSLNIPNHSVVSLEPRATGGASEIHSHTSTSLQPLGLASSRLAISSGSSQAAQKLQSQNEAIDKEKKERADRVTSGKKAVSTNMSRTQSSPQISAGPSTPTPMIPLKTRVVQLLALGPTSVSDIVKRVGGAEQDIMRVVSVVGEEVSSTTPTYSLSPAQYSKVKIASWKYTHDEMRKVVKLAKKAFDEMGLPPDADERVDLEVKEQEIDTKVEPKPSPPPVESPVKPKKTSPPPAKPNAKQIASSKQIAKFKAEAKRSSSLPIKKNESGLASPRLASIEPEKPAGKRKREVDKKKRAASPTFTSSDDSEPERGRSAKRSTNGHKQSQSKDPEKLRDRYEELFPAYQQLTQRLVDLHQSASSVGEVEPGEEEGELVSVAPIMESPDEARRLVAKWERWHNELADIRRWFGDGER